MTSPRTGAARTRRVAPTSQIDDRTRIGEIYLSSLLRAQLRLALGVLAISVGVLAGLPLVFRLLPGLTDVVLLGMPLPWVLLAFAAYPFLVGCGWLYVRRAEHNERVFAHIVEPGSAEKDTAGRDADGETAGRDTPP